MSQSRRAEPSSASAKTRLGVLEHRAWDAYRNVADVAVRVIEECRDVMELDYAVKEWRMARSEFERAERDLTR